MSESEELKEAREWLAKTIYGESNSPHLGDEEGAKLLLAYHRYREGKSKAIIDARIYEILGYVSTVRKKNTEDWMRGLVEILNKHLNLMKDSDTLIFNGDGLTIKRPPQPPKE